MSIRRNIDELVLLVVTRLKQQVQFDTKHLREIEDQQSQLWPFYRLFLDLDDEKKNKLDRLRRSKGLLNGYEETKLAQIRSAPMASEIANNT